MRLSNRIEAVFWRWTEKRVPRSRQVTLRHRSIYVIPSKSSLGFTVAIFLLWLLGTNYQNNLILAASFLLMGLFFVSIIHAFRNLSGLTLSVNAPSPGFCCQMVNVPIELSTAENMAAHDLWLGMAPDGLAQADVPQGAAATIALQVLPERRGWLQPGRIIVKSYYPLGLVRVWSWVYLDTNILIYPQPTPPTFVDHLGRGGESEEGARIQADDDFMGFVDYQPGAPLSQVAWKLYARGAGLHLKQYGGAERASFWLDYENLTGGVEQRLSGLCYLALEWHQSGRDFGLKLPGQTISVAAGEAHLHQVLKALALYQPESAK
ncbi:DUF58 domain-containing protein [Gilvimarinus sp. SDUM040013]|uniref:DUF58 domain-containing protein n=1 Tax=Gilvimarinus gilvus TaxID=3058038 RepID=A0ABU4RY24_9GAMM|nr:DUF58 domain-containing protein [Gilvimarinus sp. SDUM040013]MDO3386429.1 DUF58 domain-containing protein [Gilvimarinus sp. SDUM040013]MDX6849695.1 DUF58 domain-containing protein [Gilvimarinus sp. SDUM040013]